MQTRIKLLILPLITFLSSCQSLPPPPQGQLCIFSVNDMGSRCQPISENMIKQAPDGRVYIDLYPVQNSVDVVPVNQMDSWITTDPNTWAQIEIYINRLKTEVNQCINTGK